MSAEQAPKRRSPSVIERSQYAPNRQPPADDRRRDLDALGRDQAAAKRAKQEMAEIARQQRGQASAPVELDDLNIQQRKSQRMVVGIASTFAPTPDADQPPAAEETAAPAPQAAAVADLPPAVATTKQVRAKTAQQPAVGTTKHVNAKTTQQPAIDTTKQPQANLPAARPLFEYVERQNAQSATPARPTTAAHAAYQRDERYAPQEAYDYWEAPIAIARSNPLLVMILAIIVCVPIIWKLSPNSEPVMSFYNGAPFSDTLRNVVDGLLGQVSETQNVYANVPVGEHSILGTPSISASDVDAVLAEYKSPAEGTGKIWIELGKKYGINPAYALAFFIHESSAGTNPRWDGMKPDGSTTHNIGNISCAGYPRCLGRWRDYGSWDEGIEDWYRVIRDEYVQGRGVQTVEQIMPIYAPSFENDVDNYVQTVVTLVDGWRH